MTIDYGYFDEAYFQDGAQRGTAYLNYRESARQSATYAEIAETIRRVFQPRRALEIGCATGMVVRHLNEAGTEAHGIDVSAWAIENREHANVVLAGAEALPFPDGHFDLVYSVHALEHIPAPLLQPAIAEMTRVCREGHQFHMLPIIGEANYAGDRETVIALARKDPTHNSLHDRGEWLGFFAAQGWQDSGLRLAVFADTDCNELSICQFILGRPAVAPDLVARIAARNFDRAQLGWAKARQPLRRAEVLAPSGGMPAIPGLPTLVFGEENGWKDLEGLFDPPLDLARGSIGLVLRNLAAEPLRLRIALLTDGPEGHPAPHVLERWLDIPPGLMATELSVDALEPIQGAPDASRVVRCLLGGTAAKATLQAEVVLADVKGGRTAGFEGPLQAAPPGEPPPPPAPPPPPGPAVFPGWRVVIRHVLRAR